MPFSNEFDIVYGAIKESLTDSEYICKRVDEIGGSIPIINKILVEILKSQFIIADLTGCNPNVFYELGISHTFKDAENIFLIKEKGAKVPFDITHLTYLEYDRQNLKYMISQLMETMSKNKHISEFYEALNICGVIDYAHENQDEFIEIVKELMDGSLITITAILSCDDSVDANEAETALKSIRFNLRRNLSKYESGTLSQILNFYFELLLACSNCGFAFAEQMADELINDFFNASDLTTNEVISSQTDFALKFAKSCKQLNIVMPWIITYFKRSKFASVDLNRYKLESFLLTTNFSEINSIICNAMRDKDCHVREHLSDIIGEKRLSEAKEILCHQLICEENYYTAGSIIGSLGKLNAKEGVDVISNWISEHEAEILKTKAYFVLNRTRIALAQLDQKALLEFDSKYKVYLHDYPL
jgi:hypothetical protein